MNHECGIPRVTLHDYKSGYRQAESTEPTQHEHKRCERIVIWNHVSPWDFSRDNSGWSGEDRATELIIEANLVDPNICMELKNNYIQQYRSPLSNLFQHDHHQEHPTTMGPFSNAFPHNRTQDENIAQYLEDCQAGRYDQFHATAGETYVTECRTFQTGIRNCTPQISSLKPIPNHHGRIHRTVIMTGMITIPSQNIGEQMYV